MTGSLAYVQSQREDFNPEDCGQAHYPLLLEFPALLAYMHPFIYLFTRRFGKDIILEGQWNSFRVNLRVCVEVDLKWKSPLIYVCTIDGVR